MTLFPEYAVELGQAGDRLATRRVVRRRRARIVAIAVTTLIVLAATAIAATHWRPQLGDALRGHPSASASQPPAEQLELFGVLRRDATDADHSRDVRYALSLFTPKGITGIRTDYVRLLGTDDRNLGVVLVPAQHAGDKRDALCLWLRDSADGGGWSCYTTDEILSGHGYVGMGDSKAGEPTPKNGKMTVSGLVPDNVTTVKYNGAEVAVKGNFFTIRVPTPSRETGPPIFEWVDSDGKPVKQEPGSSPAAVRSRPRSGS